MASGDGKEDALAGTSLRDFGTTLVAVLAATWCNEALAGRAAWLPLRDNGQKTPYIDEWSMPDEGGES